MRLPQSASLPLFRCLCGQLPVSCLCGVLLVCLSGRSGWPADTASREVVRVGVVSFEDYGRQHSSWEATLAAVADAHDPKLAFALASGTYGDLLHWMQQGYLDVAVVTPGVFAESLSDYRAFQRGSGYEYLATVGYPPAQLSWATEQRRRPGTHCEYGAVCLVAAGSPLHTVKDLQREAEQDNLQYLFVNPLSLGGRIAPEIALRRVGIYPSRDQVEYTYSHTETARELALKSGARSRVGFVWDDALRDRPELAARVRKIDFPELEQFHLPQQVVAVRRGFPHRDSLQASFEKYVDAATGRTFRHLSNWQELYDQAGQWSRELQLSSLTDDSQNITLNELGEMLLHSARTQRQPPRLALVLSGGGAKCAYQIGVVAAVEEKLAELTAANPQTGVGISLIAGTSGGAINSLPMALGITSTAEGRADLQQTWMSLDQRRIICPTWILRLNVGLWFAVVQVVLVLVLARVVVPVPTWRGWVDGSAMLLLGGLNALVASIPYAPWRWLGSYHVWHHLWTWIGFGLPWSCGLLLAGGIVLLLVQRNLRRRGLFWPGAKPRTAVTLGLLLLGLPILQLPTVLFGSRTLSGGQGIEAALSSEFPRLIDRHLQRQQKPGLRLDRLPPGSNRMREISSEVIRRRLLVRDLVVTGNCLTQTDASIPSDLYFYAAARAGAPPPPFGERGVNMASHPAILMDAIMGSGTIFPIFPPRVLSDFPAAGQQVELIDGGFAHNSPIEAAVLWGATHIILIEATPATRIAMRNLAENAAAAFSHLHKQTQLVDKRSKRHVVVFTMTPRPPHLCVLDFADNLLESAIRQGYLDARGYRDQADPTLPARPTFRKELGEPVFTSIPEENQLKRG